MNAIIQFLSIDIPHLLVRRNHQSRGAKTQQVRHLTARDLLAAFRLSAN